jgi:LPPG:FO 2-phospho-L-lactate transferase
MKIVALAGGVGGAKLADGLAGILPAEDLTLVVNTADDFDHLGLHISPDLDTVVYTLAGVANPETGWGRAGDTWNFLTTLRALGGPSWFHLGDKDLALHAERTRRLAEGWSLSDVTAHVARALGARHRVLPMSDDRVRTVVETNEGLLPFQEYFVARACAPTVLGFRFEGASRAEPAPGVLEAIQAADRVILAPSNPWVSIDPILAVPRIREALRSKIVVGVSPIVGGRAIRGPAAKMFADLGIEPSALAVAEHYRGVLKGIVIDLVDAEQGPMIGRLGIEVRATATVMRVPADRRRLAEEMLSFAETLHLENSR